MPQIINTNIASLNAQRNLNKSQSANQTSLQRLSSGLRINSAKDDAAGLAISTRFNSQIRGLNVAVRNAGDGISLAQTAEGALGSMNDNLQRVRELAVQSANATNSDVDRDALQAEVSQLLSEVSRTAEETDFNGRKLLDGSFSATFQIGANAGQTLDVSIAELTADKLGSASTAGVTAIGSDQALSNGDLIINGVPIAASKAGDDTSSTSNNGASAIAKVEAINRHSGETGVTATVNENVVSGAEMTGASTTGKLMLNGIEIDLTTTTSASGSRASVEEAVNAVSEQTGVRAVNSESDTGGIQLIAEDGRNISMSVATGGTLTAASTGLALDAAPTTNAATFEGGYTLVADSAVRSVEISGGNGTGRGDLANAGLVEGTYDRGVASSVTAVKKETVTSSTVNGGSLSNDIAASNDNAQVLSAGSLSNNIEAASAVSAGILTNYQNVTVDVNGTETSLTVASGATINGVISAIDSVAGVSAFERIEFNITDFDSTTGGNTLYLANTTIALPDDDAAGSFNSAAARLSYLTEAINTASYSAGVTVTAELDAAKGSISITIDNENTAGSMRIGLSTGASITEDLGGAAVVAGLGTLASATSMVGSIAFLADAAGAVTVSISEATAGVAASGEIYTGKTYSATDNGPTALSATGDNSVNISIDGVPQTALAVGVDSTVSDLAAAINGVDDVNAWEAITLTFDATNLEIGDTIYLGTGTDVTAGLGVTSTAISVSDSDGSGGAISMTDLADNINNSDFSASNLDVSAEIDANGELVLSVKNFSGSQVGMIADAEGRSMTINGGNADDKLIGSVQKQLSGELGYSSESGAELAVTISDAAVGGEYYTGTSSSSEYAGVNGLDDGDMLINGVSIGSANITADKASAEYASDGTRILTSSKELSAIAVADSINQVSSETGVSATVNSTKVVGGTGENADVSQFDIGDSAEIYINGYVAGTVTLQDDGNGAIDTERAKSDALSVINSISGKSGVVGTDNGVSLSMEAADGRNVSIAIDDKSGSSSSIGALFGMDAAVDGIGESTFGKEPAASNNGISAESSTYQTTYGTVTLESAGEFTIAAGAEGADELAALGLTEGSYGGAVDGQFLNEIDISTFEGATAALTAIDNAIGSIASQRADLGAIQNRMESTVSNLAITSENLSAANSRIQDADFAAETAELSRTQVLQQAGISILSQANQGPQQVLSLLG